MLKNLVLGQTGRDRIEQSTYRFLNMQGNKQGNEGQANMVSLDIL